MPSLELRAQPLGRQWTGFGTDLRRGINVEDLQCSVDAAGPLDLSCVLRRSPRTTWPDLQYGTPIELDLGGDRLWAGRIKNTPGTDGDDRQIALSCEGWQFALDDRPYTQVFAVNDLSAWQDVRSNVLTDLTRCTSAEVVTSDNGGITITLPNGVTRPASTGGGVVIDLGPAGASSSQRIVLTYTTSNNSGATSILIMGATSIAGFTAMTQYAGAVSVGTLIGAGPTTFSLTTANCRYLYLSVADNTGGPATAGADVWARFSAIAIYNSTSYESGGVSVLKSSDIARDAFGRIPQISSDLSLVGSTTFAIPNFASTEQTPRQALDAANAFQDWQYRIRADLRAEYRLRPSAPILYLTDQSLFDDASSGSGEDVYNEVRYSGSAPDGTPVLVVRTTSAAGLPATYPDRRGYFKTFAISSSATLTAAAASQLCDVFLSQHNTMPFKGTIHATSRKSVSLSAGGVQVPPSKLLRYGGEKVSFKHLLDPDTGALGRDGRIAQVTYTHATDSADVSIDSTSGSYEAVTARLAVVTAR